MKKIHLGLVALLALGLASCAGNSEKSEPKPTEEPAKTEPVVKPTDKPTEEPVVPTEDPTIKVTSLELDKKAAFASTKLPVQLTATVLPENATDKTVTFTSSDPTIATVDATGLVTVVEGVKKGTVTITATSSEATILDTCTITVGTYEEVNFSKELTKGGVAITDFAADGNAIDGTSFVLNGGTKASVAPGEATIDGVTYTSGYKTGGSSQKSDATKGYLYSRCIDFTTTGGGSLYMATKTGSTNKTRPFVLLDSTGAEIGKAEVNEKIGVTFEYPSAGTYRLAWGEGMWIYDLQLRYIEGEINPNYVAKTFELSDANKLAIKETQIKEYKTEAVYGNYKFVPDADSIKHDFSKKTLNDAEVYERIGLSALDTGALTPSNSLKFTVTDALLQASTAATKAVKFSFTGLCSAKDVTTSLRIVKGETQYGVFTDVSTSMSTKSVTLTEAGEYTLYVNTETAGFALFDAEMSAVLADA